jgi:macrocin-O-methyltransferase TylF-like protien
MRKPQQAQHFASRVARWFYEQLILPHVADELLLQRIKLVWFVWGYWRVLHHPTMLFRFLRVDWNVIHSHTPSEVAIIAADIARKPEGSVFIEAGCWNGGSSCKFSLLCKKYGYSLHIYDSFEGVEDVSKMPDEWNYTGQYKASQATVKANLTRYGAIGISTIHAGWFKDTVAHGVRGVVAECYIDCDTGKGTFEVLSGVVPSLSKSGAIFSQDFHITPVVNLLFSSDTWAKLDTASPVIERKSIRLARICWK